MSRRCLVETSWRLTNARALALVALTTGFVCLPGPVEAEDAQRAAAAVPADGPVIDPDKAPRPTATAVRTDARIFIDGRLTETAWEDVEPLSTFVQSQPSPGARATEATDVRILYDSRYLYFGVFCQESDPRGLVVTSLEWDYAGASTRDFDVIAIALDTFLDRQNAFTIHVNPVGAIRDAQVADDSRSQNVAWRGIWEVKTQIAEAGWTAEIAIPWTTLRFDPAREEQVWGLNVLRRVRRKNEDSYWAPVDRRDPVHRMSRAGTLRGITGVRPGRNIAVKPYALTSARSRSARRADEAAAHVDGGADLKYAPTSQLTVDLTLRTDFSQADVDRAQVNLTRFSLFFPEQREFFLENAGVFTFGDVVERESRMGASLSDFSLFHSRRIGLVEGEPIQIVGGGRVTGRAGSFELGFLNMQTATDGDVPAENFSVVRVRRRVLGMSDVGFMVTNREATAGETDWKFNRAIGADASVRALGSLVVHSYVSATQTDKHDNDNGAARVAVVWRDRLWDISGLLKHVGEGFEPGIGFVRRTGMRQSYVTIGVHPRPKRLRIQELNPHVDVDYITGPDSSLETRTGTAGLGVEFTDGSALTASVRKRFEHLDEPFTIEGATLAPGNYRFMEGSLEYQSDRGRSLSVNAEAGGGGYYDGTRTSLRLGAIWRPHYRLSLDVSVDHNQIDLPGVSAFNADVVGMRLRYGHSTRLFGSAFVQYNTAEHQLMTNLRMNFVHAASSDLFVVYNERREMKRSGFLQRGLTVKLTRLFAF